MTLPQTPLGDDWRAAHRDRMRGVRRDALAHVNRSSAQLAMGIFIVTLGVLLMLDRLQLIDASMALRLWPAGLVVLGATILVRQPNAPGRFWGFGWMILGTWLLLNTFGIVRVGFWELFWPLVLIVLGVRLIMRTLGRGSREATSGADGVNGADGAPNLIGVLSECKRSLAPEPFRGAHMTAVLGGCVLDLRQAVLAPGEQAVIDVFAFMGGHEVVVPSAWTVVPEAMPVLGAVEDKRLPAIPDPAATGPSVAPRLLLRGAIILGGLTIKS